MQPNGNVIVDTVCRTAELGATITGATENGNVTTIEAEPVEPINECPICGQLGIFRDDVIRSLVDLPIVGHPTRCRFGVVGRGNPRSWSGFSG